MASLSFLLLRAVAKWRFGCDVIGRGRLLVKVAVFILLVSVMPRSMTAAVTFTVIPQQKYVGSAVINNAGQIAFEQGSDTGTTTIWTGLPQSPVQTATASYGISSFDNHPFLNSNGAVTFGKRMAPGDRAIWAGPAGALQIVARDGQHPVGTEAGVVFGGWHGDTSGNTFNISGFNSPGKVVFQAFLNGTGINDSNNSGVWMGDAQGLQLVARTGAAAPGTEGGTVFSYLESPDTINSSNQMAFIAALSGASVTSSNNWGIWAGNAGALSLVARHGSQAPGADPGVVFASINTTNTTPLLNAAGQIVFAGGLAGPGVTSANQNAIWCGTPNQLSMVARAGSTAPDTAAGVQFNNFANVMINASGQIAFQAYLAGNNVTTANNTGIWAGKPGAVRLVARQGDHAPGTESDTTFGLINSRGSLVPFNQDGQVLVFDSLVGPHINSSNSEGVWIGDQEGDLQLILRTGDNIDIGSGQFRTITSLGAFYEFAGSAGEDGRRSCLNDAGQAVFHVQCNDGIDYLVVATVPEPSTLVLVAVGAIGLLRCASRRRKCGA